MYFVYMWFWLVGWFCFVSQAKLSVQYIHRFFLDLDFPLFFKKDDFSLFFYFQNTSQINLEATDEICIGCEPQTDLIPGENDEKGCRV